MAALRNTALNLNRLTGHTNIASAQRQASWRPRARPSDHHRRMIIRSGQLKGLLPTLPRPWGQLANRVGDVGNLPSGVTADANRRPPTEMVAVIPFAVVSNTLTTGMVPTSFQTLT
jgi:hypothetical protein